MLARLQTDVIAYNPGYCVVESGSPNDIGSGFTLAQSTANHKAIYDALKAAGIRVVCCTPMPYGLNDTAAIRTFVNGLRSWTLNYARENGHIVADFYPSLVASDGTGLWRGVAYSDGVNANGSNGVHPMSPAAILAGDVLADALRPFVTDMKSAWLPGGNAAAYNLLANGMMTGTGGTTKPSGVTGDLSDSWSAFGAIGTGGVGTLSKVARTDGVNGEMQQYQATAGNTDGLNYQQQNITGLGTLWNVGDTVAIAAEFETDPDWVGGQYLTGQLECYGTSTTYRDLNHISSNTGIGQPPASGILLVKGVVPTGSTRLTARVAVKMTTGTLRIGRAGMWNLTHMATDGVIDPGLVTAITL
jgi:hypothetical protein